MKEFLGRIKADFLLSSVLCIALGLVFIIWRASVHSHKRAFGTAWTYGFSSGHMVSGAAKGCCEPDTNSHRSGAHFSQHQEHY